MNRRIERFLFPAAILIVTLSGVVSSEALGQGAAVRSTADGVYTPEQAERGRVEFVANCEGCHVYKEPDDAAPELSGNYFWDRWREDKLTTLYDHMTTRMPKEAEGSLSEDAYVDILAYLLFERGLPFGAEELTADRIANIDLHGPDGPQPLPNLAMIRVVGCVESSDNGWALIGAGEPQRIRSAFVESTEEELDASRAAPLGSGRFGLNDLIGGDIYPGHKVEIKGVLIKQFDGDYLNILQVASVGTGCMP